MQAIIPIDQNSDFSLHNLPFGIFKRKSEASSSFRVGIALGDQVIDLLALVEGKALAFDREVLAQAQLNSLALLGKKSWIKLREDVQALFSKGTSPEKEKVCLGSLIPRHDIEMKMPFDTRGFTDFYACKNHASHVGELYRGKENALNPNWLHIPIAYNGRANTLFPSGVNVKRPSGQIMLDGKKPIFSPSRKLDYELELGTFIGHSNEHQTPIPIDRAADHIFGHVLVNDWSARDVQAWEYVPLGPFLGKSFATSVSPWVVTDVALEPFLQAMPSEEIEPLDYLQQKRRRLPAIQLEVKLIPRGESEAYLLTKTSSSELYWSFEQMIAHHSCNGTKLDIGDLLASGTISGEESHQVGCLLEATKNGKEPIQLKAGLSRVFLEDGDTIVMTGYCEKDGKRVGFGELKATLI